MTGDNGIGLLNNLYVNEAKYSGGSPTDAFGIYDDARKDNAPNTKGKGKFFDGKPHVFKTHGSFDRQDPACFQFCSDLPWIASAHPFDGSATVNPKNAGKDFATDAVFWDQMALLYPGKYAFQIDIDGILSDIVSVETSPHVSVLEIVQQPKTTRLYDQPAQIGDIFEQQPSVRVAKVTFDANGAPIGAIAGGVKVSAMFVNDDMTAAPAMADLIERPLTSQNDDIDKPFLGSVGSFSTSTPSTMTTGIAKFSQISFLSGRTGCYRMIFYVGDSKPAFRGAGDDTIETVFAGIKQSAKKGGRWIPTMSDRVCLINNEEMKVSSKPSSITSLGTKLLITPIVTSIAKRLAIKEDPEIARCFRYRKLMLKEMQVQIYTLNIHKVLSNRKDEPSLGKEIIETFESIQGQIYDIIESNASNATAEPSRILQLKATAYQRALSKVAELKQQAANFAFDMSPEEQLTVAKRLFLATKDVVEQLKEASITLRFGDTTMGSLLAAMKMRNYKCPVFYDFNVDPTNCKIIEPRDSYDNANIWEVKGAAILFDLTDRSIKLVFDCEYMPMVVNGYKSFVHGFDSSTNSPWPNYYAKCTNLVGNNFNSNLGDPSVGMKWRKVSEPNTEYSTFPIRGDQLSLNPAERFSTGKWMGSDGSGGLNMLEVKMDNQWSDIAAIMNSSYESCTTLDPMLSPQILESLYTNSPTPAIPIVIGFSTSKYGERMGKAVENKMQFHSLEFTNAQDLERLVLKPLDSLVLGNHDAYNQQTNSFQDSTIDDECRMNTESRQEEAGTGEFSDCCNRNSDCQAGLVCHPVEYACTKLCGGEPTSLVARTFFQTSKESCDEEPLTQKRKCKQLKPSIAKVFLDTLNLNSTALLSLQSENTGNSTSAPPSGAGENATYLCSAKKGIGTSFAPYCTTCRGISLAYTENDIYDSTSYGRPPDRRYTVPLTVEHIVWSGNSTIESPATMAQKLFESAAAAATNLGGATQQHRRQHPLC